MTAGFHLYSSDDVRQLAAQYALHRKNAPEQFYSPDLFVRERIVIPSRAMRQWLERTLADQGFFLANVEFSNIRNFVSRTVGQCCRATPPPQGVQARADEDGGPEEYSTEAFGRKTMVWRIMYVLRKYPHEFPELIEYLESGKKGESPELRRYSLADKIAALFCSYLEETPELLARPELFRHRCSADFPEADSFWKSDHWQAKLWRRLCRDDAGNDVSTPADRIMTFLTADAGALESAEKLPVTVFGVGSIAPAALAVLKKLAQVATVNFFCLNPVDACWKEEYRRSWSNGTLKAEPTELESVFSSPITGRWAQHQRHFFKTVLDLAPVLGLSTETFGGHVRVWGMPENDLPLQDRFTAAAAPAAGKVRRGVLWGLQKKLRDPDADVSGFEPDDSVTIHNCHSPAREVEILHDHLLHLIESGKYTNSEILVAAPDITIFEPYVKAVFGQPVLRRLKNGTSEDCRLSYSFSGLGVHRRNPLAETFLSLLDIGRSRYELSQIEKLLMTPEVRKRFGLEDADLQNLGQWCRDAGIYWGADGEREKKFDVPDYESFSWRYGLDRMLLGFALEDDGGIDTHWKEVAPFDACDSLDGRDQMRALLEFFRDLRRTEELTGFSGTVGEWKTRLYETISTFFARDLDRKAFFRGLVGAVNLLCIQVEKSGYHEAIPFEVIRRGLADLLSVPAEDEEFLNGSITFCNLSDARSIPCKVLCLLGMDENAFPSSARPDSFDLIRGHMDRSYRSSRFQDRYFFLESLFGVRDHLLIYYRGQDDVMDKKFSPATVIAELTAYILRIFPQLDPDKLEIKHSLLPYSHDYFTKTKGDPSLSQKWSYDHYAGAVETAMRKRTAGAPAKQHRKLSYRVTSLLPRDSLDVTVTVKLHDLEEFFQNAGYVFLDYSFSFPKPTRFGGSGGRDEPIVPDGLMQWNIKDFLSRRLIEELPPQNRDLALDEVSGSDEVLDRCHKYFCRLNRLTPGGWGQSELKELASSSWIASGGIRNAWRDLCQSRENRQLQLAFEDVVQLPDEPLCTEFAVDWTPTDKLPRYRKVILQYSTRKPENTDQVMLTLGSGNLGKYLSRIFLRHLFFTASGENITSYFVSRRKEKSGFADDVMEYRAVPDDEAGGLVPDSRAWLQKILAFYLYGRKHPLPIMERCMWNDNPAGVFRCYGQNGDYGDFQLDYVRLLWGDESLEAELQKKILELQNLRRFPVASDPPPEETD